MTHTKYIASFHRNWFTLRGKHSNAPASSTRTRSAWRNGVLRCATALAALATASGYGGTVQAAAALKVLFSFVNPRGETPVAGLLGDSAGNLYGTAESGGAYGDGVVFELSPPAAGKTAWTEKVLHSFNGTNGDSPDAGLIADSAGNLYGTTQLGGSSTNCGSGCGVVFELSPPAAGKTAWTEKVLHSFNGTSGKYSYAGLIADGAGNLYGNTAQGGAGDVGVVFELSPPAAGKTAWSYKVIQTFNRTNGASPDTALLADGAGNLYGTTGPDAVNSNGVVYELSPPAPGHTTWTETLLHSFGGTDGAYPASALIADGAGNLYGTTEEGGANDDGEVFELSPPAPGQSTWAETVLFSFNGTNGLDSRAGLIADGAGNLCGTTAGGGAHSVGEAFRLIP